MKTRQDLGIVIFGLTEIVIGSITLAALSFSLFLNINTKPANVIAFVMLTSLASFGIGIGILKYNILAYNLLIFFAGCIILSKLLIFSNIITLNGALETRIPGSIKNSISIIYHLLILWYFNISRIKRLFKRGL